MENLLFDWEDIRVDRVTVSSNQIMLHLASTSQEAGCPVCRQLSAKIHSRYRRTLDDLPCCGKSVRIEIQIRRFYCLNQGCHRRLFAERRPEVAIPLARKTNRLNRTLDTIGLALGGEAGARTAGEMSILVSPDTLIRRLRALPGSVESKVHVLGVDDFALRRGQRYGTILVDEELRQPIDLLPDRESETLKRWMEKHTEIEIITRDRSGAYAKAAREGAPQAVQVADRFHLIQNAQEVVERILMRNHSALRKTASGLGPRPESEQTPEAGLAQSDEPQIGEPVGTKTARQRQERRRYRESRYQTVKDLRQSGMSIRQIAGQLGLHRRTIRKYLRSESFPEPAARGLRGSRVDRYAEYLERRMEEGGQNGAALYREIRELGYRGSEVTVRHWLRQRYPKIKHRRGGMTRSSKFRPPSPRRASWWLLKPSEELEKREVEFIEALTGEWSEIRMTQALMLEFQRIVRDRSDNLFETWKENAKNSLVPEIQGFVEGLVADESAVLEALKSKWSNGQSEGQINRLKMLKRQMYGRAKFDLLRLRVLHAP